MANLYRRVGDFAAARDAMAAIAITEDDVPDDERRESFEAMHAEMLDFIDQEIVDQQLVLAND